MNHRWTCILLLVALTTCASARGQERPATTYPESADGFEQFMKDLLQQKKSGDEKNLAVQLESAVLPDADAWMRESFGESLGPLIARSYARTRADIPSFLSESLGEVDKNGLTEMEVLVHQGPDLKMQGRVPSFAEVEIHARRPIRVFGARFTSRQKERAAGLTQLSIRYFVYAGGAYRFISFFEPQCGEASAAASASAEGRRQTPGRLRQGGDVMVARLVRMVSPAYPEAARTNRVSGAVRFRVVVSGEGCITEIETLMGHPLLAQAAEQAVRGWVYLPIFLNGKPVEVESVIEVVFSLAELPK